ncbi:MAG TPA: apolipoprotein N-acyltransferase [Thermoanaerobaculia bacterium]|nr:apolipoprotein N-acyltransferase [Thermoanaerobaculia bacterium]
MTRRLRTPLAGVLSGLLLALAFPPFEWVVLLPLALVPWLIALDREESPGRALWSGVLFGLAYWCVSISWIFYVVTHYGGQNGVMGGICLAILALILAEWPAIVAWGMVAAAPAGSGWRMAAFPLIWVATEHVRTVAYKGFPWNLTGHALYRHPVWLQTAAVWGVFGVGALVIGLSALLAWALARRRIRAFAAAALLVLVVGGWGALRLGARREDRPELPVALLQPNLTEESRATPQGAAESYRAVLSQASEAADGLPALIVIPESALPAYWQNSDWLRQDLATVAHAGPSLLFNDVEEDPDGRYYNSARLLGPQGLSGPSYRKVHLVPFGEYVPLPRIFFFVRQISTEIGAFTPAPRPALLRSGALVIGTAICYEAIYPSLAREETADGANLLATVSNDSWYGRGGAQQQHFAGAVLRSVENERYLVRAAITGISGIVDERGRILAQTRPDVRGLVRGTVRLEQASTAWTRWGYRLPLVADALAAGVLLFALARRAGPGRSPKHGSRLTAPR